MTTRAACGNRLAVAYGKAAARLSVQTMKKM